MISILITGAGSYVGTSFANYVAQWPENYRVDIIGLHDDTWRMHSFAQYEVVFHVAGIVHMDANNVDEELYYSINTNLTFEIANKAKVEGVKQFVFMSSASVYGASVPIAEKKIITSVAVPSPDNVYGDSKLQAEKQILPLEDDSFRIAILRPPMIYGRGCKGNYPILCKLAKTLPVFPIVNNQRSMLYIGNLCEFVRVLIDARDHGIFWPQNREYVNTTNMVQLIAEAHKKRMFLLPGCAGILRVMGKSTGIVNKAFGNFCYDMKMSVYSKPYQLWALAESIRETEGKH